jgi:hypothetical protein
MRSPGATAASTDQPPRARREAASRQVTAQINRRRRHCRRYSTWSPRWEGEGRHRRRGASRRNEEDTGRETKGAREMGERGNRSATSASRNTNSATKWWGPLVSCTSKGRLRVDRTQLSQPTIVRSTNKEIVCCRTNKHTSLI